MAETKKMSAYFLCMCALILVHGHLSHAQSCVPGCTCVSTTVTCSGTLTQMSPLPLSTRDIIYQDATFDTFPDFSIYHNLANIFVTRCNISSVDNCNNLDGLESIQITHSRIGKIATDAFTGSRNIGKIAFGDNSIGTIESSGIASLTSIKNLTFNRNMIGSLQSKAFYFLQNIEHFSFNRTTSPISLPYRSFYQLLSMGYIFINFNDIREIESEAIYSINCKEFSFGNNEIRNLTSGSLKSIMKKNYIYGNRIWHMENGTIEYLWGVQFNNNLFKCDCGETWLFDSPAMAIYLQRNYCYSFELQISLGSLFLTGRENLGYCDGSTPEPPTTRAPTTSPTTKPPSTTTPIPSTMTQAPTTKITSTARPTTTTAKQTTAQPVSASPRLPPTTTKQPTTITTHSAPTTSRRPEVITRGPSSEATTLGARVDLTTSAYANKNTAMPRLFIILSILLCMLVRY